VNLTEYDTNRRDFCAALELTGVDLVANDTGGAVAQIVAAHQPQRLATLTLTNCETQGNVPPRAFKPAVLLARAGLLAPMIGPRLLRNLPAARKRLYGKGFRTSKSCPSTWYGRIWNRWSARRTWPNSTSAGSLHWTQQGSR
jgi:pimeloyl-ACP methyl ester carboxylesterase